MIDVNNDDNPKVPEINYIINDQLNTSLPKITERHEEENNSMLYNNFSKNYKKSISQVEKKDKDRHVRFYNSKFIPFALFEKNLSQNMSSSLKNLNTNFKFQ